MLKLTNEQKAAASESIVSCLRSALAADPAAIRALVVNRVPTNQAMVDHPHMVCDGNPVLAGREPTLGVLGVVNGLLSALDLPKVASQWDETDTLTGFCQYRPPESDETVDQNAAELVMVAYAATIPDQCITSFQPRSGASSCIIDQPTNEVGPSRCFSLSPVVVVGTLEDIIEDFGRKLREAHAALKETQHITGYGPEHQNAIREVFERQSNGGSGVEIIPFIA